jgi:hypothetical protein
MNTKVLERKQNSKKNKTLRTRASGSHRIYEAMCVYETLLEYGAGDLRKTQIIHAATVYSLGNLSMYCRTKSIDNSYAYNGMLWKLFF